MLTLVFKAAFTSKALRTVCTSRSHEQSQRTHVSGFDRPGFSPGAVFDAYCAAGKMCLFRLEV